jgi:hypothetical protein
MLNLLFAWGPPAAKLTPNDAAAAAAGEEQELDWESWPGQVEMSAGLQQAGDEELTAIFKVNTHNAQMYLPGRVSMQSGPVPPWCQPCCPSTHSNT